MDKIWGFGQPVDFLNGPVFSSIVLFAVPVFFSNIFQQFYNTMDTVIIGYTLGEASLAAIGAATPVYDLLIGFVLGFGSGLSIVVGRCYGSGDRELLKRECAGCILVGAAVSLAVTLLSGLILRPLLVLLGTPDEILEEAFGYISVIMRFAIVMFAYNLCAGLLRAVGNSTAPLFFLVFSSLLNIGLDFLFIRWLYWGVKGAAVATVAAQAVSVALCLLYIRKKAAFLVPQRRHFRVDTAILTELSTQGFSLGMMSCLVAAGSVILQSGINGLGYLVIAGHTAARRIFIFFNMLMAAVVMALSAFVSQNYGADRPDRIRKAMKSAYLFNIGSAVCLTCLLLPGAPLLIRLISGSSSSTILANGSAYLRVVAPFYLVLGILNDTRTALQAIGKKFLPVISSVIELVGKIVFTAVFIPLFGYTAVIFCEPVIWCFMTVQLLISFWAMPYIRKSKLKNLVQKEMKTPGTGVPVRDKSAGEGSR